MNLLSKGIRKVLQEDEIMDFAWKMYDIDQNQMVKMLFNKVSIENEKWVFYFYLKNWRKFWPRYTTFIKLYYFVFALFSC